MKTIVLTGGGYEAEVAADYGPRVVGFRRKGGRNVLGAAPDVAIRTPWGTWRARGGHRLWAAPENRPRSYVPDDAPPALRRIRGGLAVTGAVERPTGLQKSLELTLSRAGLRVRHRLTNRGRRALMVAPWALTILAPGGTAIVPREPYKTWEQQVEPAAPLVLWPYTDLNDPRLRFTREAVYIRNDPGRAAPNKLGFGNSRGWASYKLGRVTFTKRFAAVAGAAYPDFGCTTQVYTAGAFIELETLGPLRRLRPGETVDHVELWTLS